MLFHNGVDEECCNPVTKSDYPDPDVIRVGDTYYMATTTMHFMPGCEILRSYDLCNWEHLTYVYDKLDSTSRQTLEGEQKIYGQGMWATTLRYHKGRFYICFVADSLEGEFRGCDVLKDDMGYCYQGVAQGGIVDTPGLGTDIYCREWHVDPEIPMSEDCLGRRGSCNY